MIKVFCDKCEKELEEYEIYTIEVIPPEIRRWGDELDYNRRTLCTKCAEEFLKALKH